ncbi:decaprenylphospho-beta-D-erythro-pentofuranosid-2 -ulose 2-reductase [Streptomonospora sediminis]
MRNAVGAVDSVLLLGGRSEIGAAVAERLVRDGARRVVLAARGAVGSTGAAGTAERLRAAGAAEVHLLDFDGARPETHTGVVDTAAGLVGDLDAVVDAFGVLGDQAAFDADPVAAAEAAAATYTGHVSVGIAVARRLREQGHGTLVVLSSVAGVRVRRANFVYGSAKAGLDGFAQGLGDALHGSGARVLIVRPGYVRTQMSAHVPAAPLAATAEQVADAVAGGLRTGAETVWVPRRLRLVFAGMRALPRPLWRRLRR